MAKRIRISDDNGTNWYTLPGNQGELSNEAGTVDDTIFGQDWQSQQSTLVNWSVSANALYKGFAGYLEVISKSGTATAMTDEACSLVSGKIYRITAATKRVLDPATAVVVKDNAVAVNASNILRIDLLDGVVEFTSGYTVVGAITISGKYLPMSQIAKGRSFTLTQTAEPIDITDFETAQANSGKSVFQAGLRTFSLDVSGVFATANGWAAALASRAILVISINPEGSGASVAKGFFQPASQNQSGNVGELEEETITFNGYVPDNAQMETPFRWYHTNSTLSTAIQKLLTAWQTGASVDVQYLHDGTNGISGEAFVTDLTLAGGLEVVNEFTVSLQGSGATAPVP
jgi:predicted secreted protein